MMKSIHFSQLISLCALALVIGCSSGSSGSSDSDGGSANPTAKWYVAKGAPSDAQGVDGDLYLDQDAAVLYVKAGGKWVTAASLRGAAGNGWLFGTGAPAASLGVNGDFYLDTASTMTYRKYNGAWVSMFSLQGAAGADGSAWYTGTADPTPSVPAAAKAGDFYLNIQTTVIWRKTAAGSWSSVVMFQTSINPQFVFTPFMNDSDYNGVYFNAVAYGNGAFVAAGSNGTLVRSTDGKNWTLVTYGPPPPNPSIMVKRSAGTGKSVIAETTPYPSTSAELRGAAYGNGTFVVVGDPYSHPWAGDYVSIFRSTNGGISWETVVVEDGPYYFTSVSFQNGLFFAVGSLNPTYDFCIWTSVDGTDWIERSSSTVGTYNRISNVVYGNGKYLAVGFIEGAETLTSANGTTWAVDWESTLQNVASFEGAAYGNGVFTAVGVSSIEYTRPVVWTSLDGSAWYLQDLPLPTSTESFQFKGVTFGNGFAAVCRNTTDSRSAIATSPNGISWSYQEWPTEFPFTAAAWGALNGGTFAVALGDS